MNYSLIYIIKTGQRKDFLDNYEAFLKKKNNYLFYNYLIAMVCFSTPFTTCTRIFFFGKILIQFVNGIPNSKCYNYNGNNGLYHNSREKI